MSQLTKRRAQKAEQDKAADTEPEPEPKPEAAVAEDPQEQATEESGETES
jgi:hypothetical protein